MWIDDCIQSILSIMQTPSEKLKQRTYNVTAMSFTPEELAKAIQKYKPNFKISYEIDSRQKIGKVSGCLCERCRWSPFSWFMATSIRWSQCSRTMELESESGSGRPRSTHVRLLRKTPWTRVEDEISRIDKPWKRRSDRVFRCVKMCAFFSLSLSNRK